MNLIISRAVNMICGPPLHKCTLHSKSKYLGRTHPSQATTQEWQHGYENGAAAAIAKAGSLRLSLASNANYTHKL